MERLTVVTWWWGEKYGVEYVVRLAKGLTRNLKQDFRFLVVCDTAQKMLLLDTYCIEATFQSSQYFDQKGCFARLEMFSPRWQRLHCLSGQVACLDLDLIVTGPVDEIFDRKELFVILQGANATNPCPFNGSVWMLRAGCRPDVWKDFSLEAAAKVPFDSFPDDQAWMHHKMPDAAGWKAGPESGIYAFKKPGWPAGNALPSDARIVCFPGSRDPSHYTALPWVKQHWQ